MNSGFRWAHIGSNRASLSTRPIEKEPRASWQSPSQYSDGQRPAVPELIAASSCSGQARGHTAKLSGAA